MSELDDFIQSELRQAFRARCHETGVCPDCCVLCGWCPHDEDHPCMGTGRLQGLAVNEAGDLTLADGTPFPPI